MPYENIIIKLLLCIINIQNKNVLSNTILNNQAGSQVRISYVLTEDTKVPSIQVRQLTNTCTSSSRDIQSLWPPQAPAHMHGTTLRHIKYHHSKHFRRQEVAPPFALTTYLGQLFPKPSACDSPEDNFKHPLTSSATVSLLWGMAET